MDASIDVSHKLEGSSGTVQGYLDSTTGTRTVPARYVFNTDANASNITYLDAPIIDLQLLLDVSSPLAKQELIKLHAALNSYGCFQLVNHGVATSLIHILGKEFFASTGEEKLKFSRAIDSYEAYGRDAVPEDKLIYWNCQLYLGTHPVEQRNYKLWPDNVPNFRETLEDYSDGMRNVIEGLLKAIAKASDLEENIFFSKFGDNGNIAARFNYYPPCPFPEKMIGLPPHSDGGLVTLILQDKEVESLQVLKDNQWYKVPVIPDALFILVSDQLEILSNGILKSVVHKTVTDKEKSRLSVAVPCSVPDNEIGPLSELISADRPQLYRNVKNYVQLYRECIKKGERAIETIKIHQ